MSVLAHCAHSSNSRERRMIKELFLIPRLLYTVLFIGFAISATGITSPMPWMVKFAMVFILSFVFQYFVLHYVLKRLGTSQSRIIMFVVWMVLATLVGAWGLGELASFDYLQSNDTKIVARNFAWKLVIYSTACEMFIAGACARRAFQKHGGF